MSKTYLTTEGLDFQSIFLNLQQYWASRGAAILQPYDMEVGAGTFHPATSLRRLGTIIGAPPMCSRHAVQPMVALVKIQTVQHYYQFQTIFKPYTKQPGVVSRQFESHRSGSGGA